MKSERRRGKLRNNKSNMVKRNSKSRRERAAPVGVVGLGLMGSSITACLLAAGHPVTGIDRNPARRKVARRHILSLLDEMRKEKLLARDPRRLIQNFTASEELSALRDCALVVEAITENLESKREVLRQIEDFISPEALIGSNTSALPVTELQKNARHPERVLGIHWAEPAHITRFMEIICGAYSDPANAEKVRGMAQRWQKEPTLVRRDVRGFITNRIMYAMIREAFYLVEAGYATPADVDRSLRNDLGYWITFAGPFRYMDLTGIPAYAAVMRDLLPDLSRDIEVPALMNRVVESGARGVSNAKGFYNYTPAEARRWAKRFLQFSYEIRALALKYAERPHD
jgi:3-hydroxybutyryl-CoA dehydrogenase